MKGEDRVPELTCHCLSEEPGTHAANAAAVRTPHYRGFASCLVQKPRLFLENLSFSYVLRGGIDGGCVCACAEPPQNTRKPM